MDDIQGTAAVLNATKEYEELAHELTDEVAQVFVANEINKVEPAAKVTPSDIGSFIKVTKILRKVLSTSRPQPKKPAPRLVWPLGTS